MKRITILLLIAVLSVNVFFQSEEFLYSNPAYGVEIKFPSKPVISGNNISRTEQPSASLSLLVEGGLTYNISILRNNALVNYVNLFKRIGGLIKCQYEVGNVKVTEINLQQNGVCYTQ